MKGKIIYLGLAVGLGLAVLLRFALASHFFNSGAAQPSLAVSTLQAPLKPVSDEDVTRVAATAPPVAAASPALAAVAEGQTAAAGGGSDGKTVIPPDGKTVLPMDGKTALPPVGELVGQRPDSVIPGEAGPPVEYLNKNSNPLLTPPNPANVSGPLVSGEVPNPR